MTHVDLIEKPQFIQYARRKKAEEKTSKRKNERQKMKLKYRIPSGMSIRDAWDIAESKSRRGKKIKLFDIPQGKSLKDYYLIAIYMGRKKNKQKLYRVPIVYGKKLKKVI